VNHEREIREIEHAIARLEKRREDTLKRAAQLLHTSNFSCEAVVAERRAAAALLEHIGVARDRLAALREPFSHVSRGDRSESRYIAGERQSV
jgi:hypothetical protein